MARIQVLPLTTRTLGPASETPFVLIIDLVGDERDEVGCPVYTPEMLERLNAELGAQSVLVVDGELTVANVDEELHRAAQAAVERALNPERLVEV
jgi:hypothetical protein